MQAPTAVLLSSMGERLTVHLAQVTHVRDQILTCDDLCSHALDERARMRITTSRSRTGRR